MPAAIRVIVPQVPPLYRWIEAEVIRIGSKLENEICIAGLASHVATVVFREGSYWLVNRTQEPLLVGRGVIEPGQDGIWADGTQLQLSGGVSLTLIRHADPRPVLVEPGRLLPAIDAPERQRVWNRQRRREWICFAITAFAVFVTGYLSRAENGDHRRPAYDVALRALREAPVEARAEFAMATDWIHRAYSLDQRGDSAAAFDSYRQARELLLHARPTANARKLRQQLLQYVALRLATS
jgi:hypothetical protein